MPLKIEPFTSDAIIMMGSKDPKPNWIQSLKKRLNDRLKARFDQIELETYERFNRGEQRKFSTRPFRLAGVVGIIVMIYFSHSMIDPGEKPYTLSALKKAGSRYELVKQGKIFTAEGEPPNLRPKEVHEFIFDESKSTWPWARQIFHTPKEPNEFWYSFEIHRATSTSKDNPEQVLIPKVFGQSFIFKNGELIAADRDLRKRIELTEDVTRIEIKVKSIRNDPFVPGITAFYPLVIGSEADLAKIENYIGLEIDRFKTVLDMQVIAFIIVLGLILSGPSLAEVVPLGSFLLVNLGYAVFTYMKHNGKIPEGISQEWDNWIKLTFVLLQSLMFIWFGCEFFRKNKKSILKTMKQTLFLWVAWISLCILVIKDGKPGGSGWTAVLAMNYLFFGVATLVFVGMDYFYVLMRGNDLFRKFISTAFVGSFVYFYYSAFMNYFLFTSQTSSELMVQFINYVAVLVIVAGELGRSTLERDDQRGKLPKENAGEPKHEFSPDDHPCYEAFVIMCDAAEYSVKLWKLRKFGEKIVSHYQDRVQDYLLKSFSTPATSNHSSMGDGFYFGIRWDWNRDNLLKLLRMCRKLIGEEVKMKDIGVPWLDQDTMRVRCIIAYGTYTMTKRSVNGIGSITHGGELATLLQRGSGSGKDPIALRILINEYTKGFLNLPVGKKLETRRKSQAEGIEQVMEFSIGELDQILKNEEWISRIFDKQPHGEAA